VNLRSPDSQLNRTLGIDSFRLTPLDTDIRPLFRLSRSHCQSSPSGHSGTSRMVRSTLRSVKRSVWENKRASDARQPVINQRGHRMLVRQYTGASEACQERLNQSVAYS
jgi:hypothetical protein